MCIAVIDETFAITETYGDTLKLVGEDGSIEYHTTDQLIKELYHD